MSIRSILVYYVCGQSIINSSWSGAQVALPHLDTGKNRSLQSSFLLSKEKKLPIYMDMGEDLRVHHRGIGRNCWPSVTGTFGTFKGNGGEKTSLMIGFWIMDGKAKEKERRKRGAEQVWVRERQILWLPIPIPFFLLYLPLFSTFILHLHLLSLFFPIIFRVCCCVLQTLDLIPLSFLYNMNPMIYVC